MNVSNYITTSTVMLRRDVLHGAGSFEARIGRSSTDWDMWLGCCFLRGVSGFYE